MLAPAKGTPLDMRLIRRLALRAYHTEASQHSDVSWSHAVTTQMHRKAQRNAAITRAE